VYPYAGKSTVGRGSEPGEGNVPPPTGVIDLQLHPPNNSKLTVAAFVVPVSGTYLVSNLAARRTATGGNGVDYQVFNKNKTLVVTLKAGTNQDWVQDTVSSRSLGALAAGDRIYFSVYRQISDFSDHTEVAWTITLTGTSARTAYAADGESASRAGLAVRVAPNPGSDFIRLSGLGQRGTVRVYDALGRLQAYKPFTSREGRVELSAIVLPPGLYYLLVQSDEQLSRHKWLKQ
jgi:hypothetical protein